MISSIYHEHCDFNQVLLENELTTGRGTTESGERFKKLFRLMYSVQELLSEKQVGFLLKRSSVLHCFGDITSNLTTFRLTPFIWKPFTAMADLGLGSG